MFNASQNLEFSPFVLYCDRHNPFLTKSGGREQ
jgi:hypothetical protein